MYAKPRLPPPERQPKLLYVRIHEGKRRMDVVVEDPLWKKRRTIKYRWQTRERKSEPPERWFEAICGEVEYQRQEDFKKKMGRKIP